MNSLVDVTFANAPGLVGRLEPLSKGENVDSSSEVLFSSPVEPSNDARTAVKGIGVVLVAVVAKSVVAVVDFVVVVLLVVVAVEVKVVLEVAGEVVVEKDVVPERTVEVTIAEEVKG